jgi:hypothetical protein
MRVAGALREGEHAGIRGAPNNNDDGDDGAGVRRGDVLREMQKFGIWFVHIRSRMY